MAKSDETHIIMAMDFKGVPGSPDSFKALGAKVYKPKNGVEQSFFDDMKDQDLAPLIQTFIGWVSIFPSPNLHILHVIYIWIP